jgi:capsular polysaccharide transport system ATP-binding protein
VDLAMSYPQAAGVPLVVLAPGTISLPSDRRLAILAERRRGKTTLLNLLSGKLRADQGEAICADSLSPVLNAGALLHPQLSIMENIRFLARAYGFHPDTMLMAADCLLGQDMSLDRPLKDQDGNKRRQLEAAIMVALPFQCYLIDELGLLEPELLARCWESFTDRQAGVVFATSQPRFVSQYADTAVIIDEGRLLLFQDIKEAIAYYEAKRHS